MKIAQQGLNTEEEIKILEAVNKFVKWLSKRNMIENMPSIQSVDLPSADGDWIVKFYSKTGQVVFNTALRKKCSFDYFKSIILHEFFHLAVQKLPNKEDATRVKDDFGDELMRLIDIEADFYTALFYKEVLGFSLVEYLKIYYDGNRVFMDKWIRIGKLQRYIGTLLTICKLYFQHPKKLDKVEIFDLYLVAVSPLYTEENIHVLVVRKEHIYFDTINAKRDDFLKIRECYTNVDSITFKGYVEKIVNFTSQALVINIPLTLTKEIEKIK
jgi:hypothetical protein